ncbi:MAG: TRAP transporter substrate-binding protein [Proteobacteria bacterium]|nr:TRAP transporter substrate-binding protein [Pseudomonadota bacterium]
MEGLVAGQIQVAIPSTGYLSTIVPSFEAIDLPMLFGSQEALYKFEDSSVAADMLSELEAKRMKGLGFASNVSLDLFSKQRIVNPADFSGKKIRAHSAVLEETVKALGGNPVTMPASELYLALQQGVVDGAFTTVTYAGPNNYNEVTGYLLRAAVSSIAYPVVVNLDFWKGLNDVDRKAIVDAVAVATQKNRAELDKAANDAVASLKSRGVTVLQLDDAQRSAWKEKLAPIYTDFGKRVSETLLGKITALQ